MSVQPVNPSVEPAHIQVAAEIVPSGSVRVAVRAIPNTGCPGARATAPASSSSVTVTVTARVTLSVVPSVASTVTR